MRQETRDRPRIADVAREAGVSKTAVSFAFNSPERLSPDTATRIRDVAASLGYRPHPVARMLTQGRTRTLGILTPQALSVVFANPFFASFSEGVAAVAEEAGYGLLFVSPVYGSLARAVNRATVDGFVAIGLSEDHPEVEQIRRAGLPIVMVDSAAAFPEHAAVDVDDEGGARLAAEHLLELGHRDFLVIGVEPPTPGSQADFGGIVGRRLKGYRDAIAETIENNVRRKIIKEHLTDPAYYDTMSALLDEIIAAFEMLDVKRGINVYTGVQQFLHVLEPFYMP